MAMMMMMMMTVLFAVITVALCQDTGTQPLYKYRYQTEDVMNTAATSIPVRGYHVVEGGYYPQVAAGGAGGIGLAGGAGGYGGGIGLGGAGLGYGGAGGGGAGLGYGGAGLALRSIGTVGGAGLGYGGGIGGAGLGYGGAGIGGAGLGYGGAGIGGAGLGYGGAGLGLKAIGPVGAGIGGAGLGYGGGIGGAGIVGGGGIGGAGIVGGGGIGGAGIGGGQLLYPGYGGEYIDKNIYSGGKKNLNDEKFEKASGKKGEEFGAGNEGYAKGIAAVKDAKGESGYYNDQSGGKKAIEDGKFYSGGQQFNQQGKNGGEFNEKSGHKKGHVIKGYKSSHHKDETGKTEEFYDEANDEGGKLNFNGQSGSFGKLGQASYKGGHANDEFTAGGQKKQGHFDNQHIIDNSNANQGNYGQKKYGGSGAVYGVNNGIDEQSLLGHQENSRFYKHHPHHVPFY